MIKYSVITPVFNRADCIERCLESVSRNVGGRDDIEHIVVDDGSSDETPEIVRKYASCHPHLRCIFFPVNRGTNAARNAAIATARGRFCVILDSDDYWDVAAIKTIDAVVDAHPDVRHFCFAPDDMQQAYDANPLLHGQQSVTLTYEDFLFGKVGGDFVHVMTTDIIKRHPFDEQLRIYEGVFFLAFYKEAKTILFTNQVVSHRERGRSDSVTREVIRTNKPTILRTIKAKELLIENYSADLKKSDEGAACLYRHYVALLDNYLLLGNYKKARGVIDEIGRSEHPVLPSALKWIYRLRLGRLYFYLLCLSLRIKYNVLKTRLR